MLRNYYYLNRTIVELNSLLKGANITEIYVQEKGSLYLSIPIAGKPNRHLFISTNPTLPYLLIKDNHRKAKKNIYQINVTEKDDRILSVEISKNDRLIKISLSNTELYFSIMGGNTNVYFIRNGEIVDMLRKSKNDGNILRQIENSEFTDKFIFHEIDEELFSDLDIKKIKKEYSFIPKEIINEMKYRDETVLSIKELFHSLLREVFYNDIKVFLSVDEDKVRFVPKSFRMFNLQDYETFNNCNVAIAEYLRKHFGYLKKRTLQKVISRTLSKELERTTGRLNNLKVRIERGDRSSEYYNYGNQLLANRHLLSKGMEKLIVNDYGTGKELNIKLNRRNSPQESIDAYFEKARDEKISYQKSVELYKESNLKYNRLKNLEDDFKNATSINELLLIKEKLKIADKKFGKKKVIDGVKLREFLVDNRYKVLVGRDSKSNDMLSIKIAKQNDYWFHARGLPGSHVVLRVENTKEGIPKNILKNVAQIAAFYSKAKTAGTAPVSYTLAKFVRKKKGMEPGKVIIEKEKVLLVRPEIPQNTQLITEE